MGAGGARVSLLHLRLFPLLPPEFHQFRPVVAGAGFFTDVCVEGVDLFL